MKKKNHHRSQRSLYPYYYYYIILLCLESTKEILVFLPYLFLLEKYTRRVVMI